MGLINKIATAFRGSLREGAEIVVDANAMRIFAQEIHECEKSISHSKHQLATIIAQRTRSKRELDHLQSVSKGKEEKIAELLSQGREEEALKQAQLMAEKEPLISRQQAHYKKLLAYETSLQENLKKMVTRLESYRSEYQMLKATESLQSAQTELSSHRGCTQSTFGNMQESLARIQSRQQEFADQMSAMDQVDAYLSDDYAEPSETESAAKDILESIRKKSAS